MLYARINPANGIPSLAGVGNTIALQESADNPAIDIISTGEFFLSHPRYLNNGDWIGYQQQTPDGDPQFSVVTIEGDPVVTLEPDVIDIIHTPDGYSLSQKTQFAIFQTPQKMLIQEVHSLNQIPPLLWFMQRLPKPILRWNHSIRMMSYLNQLRFRLRPSHHFPTPRNNLVLPLATITPVADLENTYTIWFHIDQSSDYLLTAILEMTPQAITVFDEAGEDDILSEIRIEDMTLIQTNVYRVTLAETAPYMRFVFDLDEILIGESSWEYVTSLTEHTIRRDIQFVGQGENFDDSSVVIFVVAP